MTWKRHRPGVVRVYDCGGSWLQIWRRQGQPPYWLVVGCPPAVEVLPLGRYHAGVLLRLAARLRGRR